MNSLTWDDLARLYRERTGGNARIRPMDEIFQWAERQADIISDGDDGLKLTPSDDSE